MFRSLCAHELTGVPWLFLSFLVLSPLWSCFAWTGGKAEGWADWWTGWGTGRRVDRRMGGWLDGKPLKNEKHQKDVQRNSVQKTEHLPTICLTIFCERSRSSKFFNWYMVTLRAVPFELLHPSTGLLPIGWSFLAAVEIVDASSPHSLPRAQQLWNTHCCYLAFLAYFFYMPNSIDTSHPDIGQGQGPRAQNSKHMSMRLETHGKVKDTQCSCEQFAIGLAPRYPMATPFLFHVFHFSQRSLGPGPCPWWCPRWARVLHRAETVGGPLPWI